MPTDNVRFRLVKCEKFCLVKSLKSFGAPSVSLLQVRKKSFGKLVTGARVLVRVERAVVDVTDDRRQAWAH